MKAKKFIPAARGLTAVMLSTVMLSTTAYGLATGSYRSQIDEALGTTSYIINEDKDAARFKSDYATEKDMIAAAKAHAIKQGEEGFVLMKNRDNALPMTTSATAKQKVALFGGAAYVPYQASSDLKAGNADSVDLVKALEDANFEVNGTVKGIYDTILSKGHEEPGQWGGPPVFVPDYAYKTAPGDWQDEFQIMEVPADRLTDSEIGNAPADWKSSIDKNETVGICVFARGAGEGNTYKPGSATDFNNNPTGKDPLGLSDDELSIVDVAKETCSKVIVLINSGNAMELGAIAEGGAHEVDAIGYIGVPNDYQFTGIVNVLSGKANATGALSDTYVYNNLSAPATVNLGGDEYADASIAASNGTDPRYPGVQIENRAIGSFDRANTYSGSWYIVEAEGIYVGYKYYETRYYDSIMNPTYNANSVKGSTDGAAWDYNKEVVYTFGHGLSYYDYDQKVTAVNVDPTNSGNITATISIHNKSSQDGYFLGQLYVSTPYTDYDKQNNVEKAAISFLTSGKTYVAAGATETVEVSVPTKYLASYDSKTAKTYILDEGDYYFTAGAGAHEAVNNVLAFQGKTTADGMDAAGDASAVQVWNKSSRDTTAFASDHGVQVTNQFDNADLNYWLPGKVKYLSRQDWDDTYPINYNEVEVRIGDSAKRDEWIREIRGQQYTIKTDGEEAINVEGKDEGESYKFKPENVTYESLTNIDADFWQTLVNQISVSEAVGGVIHGGSRTEVITNIDNPIVGQSEGVNGFTGTLRYEEDGEQKTAKFNVSSQTLLATSFNPQLAYEWGLIQGNSGLWLQSYTDWGTGLTQRRTVYNGRNYEYVSEDSMLTNVMGYGILKGTAEKGICTGPKHMGANDQEYMRAGIAEYMTEQKIREGDLRGFQGGLSEGGGLAVMIAFNRIGATNAAHHVGMLQNVLRGEWGFKYIVSTDMMSNLYYFNPEAMVMAGITQVADFATDDFNITHASGGWGQAPVYVGHDGTWEYISVDSVKNDPEFIQQARQDLKYQLYAFANSAVLNISTIQVTPWWESALVATIAVSATLTGLAGIAWIACHALSVVKKEED